MRICSALVVVYDYHPNAQTLFDVHVQPQVPPFGFGHGRAQSDPRARVPEQTVWTIVSQVASALKAIHEAGLACRILDITKVLVTGKNRFVPPQLR